MSKFSRMLSAAIFFALAAAFSAGAANAGSCGRNDCERGYHGRHAGAAAVKIPQVRVPNVAVYTGGASHWQAQGRAVSPASAFVTVYYGGGFYANEVRYPENIDGLEVVTVTRGAGNRNRIVDAICVARGGQEMPAARVRRGSTIESSKDAELFRCESSFELRAFVSQPGGRAAGSEVVCDPGLSLWSSRNGSVHCRPKRGLAMSEAEMRHAFGLGAITVEGTRAADHASVVVTRGLSLSGGVGYAPY